MNCVDHYVKDSIKYDIIAIFFSKIRRDETIRMIYVLPEMDKNVQRYLASNTPKIGFFKIMAGRKEAGSN